MRDSERKKRTYIIVGLCSILMIMAVGFAVFSQQLQINSTSEVTGDWCLGFDNTKTNTLVATPGIQTGTTPTGSMTYGGSTCGTKSQVGVTLASVFKQPGDSIEYTLTILNEGSLNAAINSILIDNTSVTSDQIITKGNVKYKIEMPLSTSVAANGSTTMKVTASFQNDVDITKSFGGDSASIEVKINAEEDDGNGGFEVTGRPYTGTIYNSFPTRGETMIGGSITGGEEVNVWCEVGTRSGESFNSCTYAYDWYYDSQSDCEDDIANWVSSGNGEPGDLTCQYETIKVGGAGEYTTSQAEIQSQYNYYLKHTVVNDIITETYACFVTDTEHCLKGGVDECDWDDEADNGNGACTYSGTPTVFNSNNQIIQNYQTYNNLDTYQQKHNPGCVYNDTSYFINKSYCYGGNPYYHIEAYRDGRVEVSIGDYTCSVSDDGGSGCFFTAL